VRAVALLGRTAAAAGVVKISLSGDSRTDAVSAAALLLFAVGAAVFQSVNERTLRHTGAELAALVDLGGVLERARRPDDVLAALIQHLRERLGFVRVLVIVRGSDTWVASGHGITPGRTAAHSAGSAVPSSPTATPASSGRSTGDSWQPSFPTRTTSSSRPWPARTSRSVSSPPNGDEASALASPG